MSKFLAIAAIAAALALAATVAATGPSALASGSSGGHRVTHTIGLVPGAVGEPFDDEALQGALTAATALGDGLIRPDWAPGEGDPTLQATMIDSLISQHVAAIAVDPDDAAAVKPLLAQAQAAGIATLSYKEEVPGGNAVWVSPSGKVAFAHALADALASQMGRKGRYVIMGEDGQFPIANEWQRAVRLYIAKRYPHMKLLRVIHESGAGDSSETAQVKRFLITHRKLKGVVSITPTETFVLGSAIRRAHKVGKIFAAGNPGDCPPVTPPLTTYVASGAEQVVCGGDPIELGYLTVWAADYLAEGHTFAPGTYDVGGPVGSVTYYAKDRELRLGQPVTITQANLNQYMGH